MILAPGLLLFIGLLIFAGRTEIATQTVQHAAAAAAREASIARDSATAQADARTSASLTLTQQGLQCVSSSVQIDTDGFNVPVGQPATVTATVTCVVSLADLAVPGLPGSHTVTATVTSPLDIYRQRS